MTVSVASHILAAFVLAYSLTFKPLRFIPKLYSCCIIAMSWPLLGGTAHRQTVELTTQSRVTLSSCIQLPLSLMRRFTPGRVHDVGARCR